MKIPKNQMPLIRKVAGMFPPPPILRMAAPGFDISDDEVRYMDLVDTGNGKEIFAFGSKPLEKGIIKRGDIRKKEELIKIIKNIVSENNFNFVRSSLPDERAYLFQTDVGADMKPEEIKTMLDFKLEEYVPLSSEEAIFDYTPIGLEPKREEMKISVSVFSRKIVNKYIEVFEKAGVVPFSLETDTQAISRAVISSENENKNYLIVNFGNIRTNLAIVYNGVVSFTSTLEIGGRNIDKAIQKHLSSSPDEIRKIKSTLGFVRNMSRKELFFSIMSTVNTLKDEINKHLSYWRSRMRDGGGDGDIDEIILCGENAGLAGLADYLEKSMKIPTHKGDVWRNAFPLEGGTPSIHKHDSYSYATAIGLALRREGKE